MHLANCPNPTSPTDSFEEAFFSRNFFWRVLYGDGSIVEVAKTASGYSSPVTLVSFNGTDGWQPVGTLIADANGDLFGTTWSGGAYGGGTVFEIAKTATGYAGTPMTLIDFAAHSEPAALCTDANGDLFETTWNGGVYGDGSIVEVAKTASGYSSPVTLVSFNGPDGSERVGTLIADANGDLFGTTQSGGAYDDGTVFEIVRTAFGYTGTSHHTGQLQRYEW